MKKICNGCSKEYFKDINSSKKNWKNSKCCSHKCWGIYLKRVGIKPPPRINCTPWNKGLKGFMAGEKNGFWKGGVSKLHKTARQLDMQTLEYKLWRTSVFERDNYKCVKCNARCGNGKKIILEADHIKPYAYFPELRYSIDNGRTLCQPCHRKTDTYSLNQYSNKKDFSWVS